MREGIRIGQMQLFWSNVRLDTIPSGKCCLYDFPHIPHARGTSRLREG